MASAGWFQKSPCWITRPRAWTARRPSRSATERTWSANSWGVRRTAGTGEKPWGASSRIEAWSTIGRGTARRQEAGRGVGRLVLLSLTEPGGIVPLGDAVEHGEEVGAVHLPSGFGRRFETDGAVLKGLKEAQGDGADRGVEVEGLGEAEATAVEGQAVFGSSGGRSIPPSRSALSGNGCRPRARAANGLPGRSGSRVHLPGRARIRQV